MLDSLQYVNLFVAVGAVVLQVVTLLVILLLIFSRRENKILSFIKENFLSIGFLLSLVPLLVSLFYSDVIGFAPCKLCWLQRIALYPSCLLFGLAWWKKDRNISFYIFPLLVFGSLVALYHNFIYYFGEGIAPCDSSGVSCVQRLVSEFGSYISIPSLSLTSFVSLIVLLAVVYFYKKDN